MDKACVESSRPVPVGMPDSVPEMADSIPLIL
jgi:hypothetical protein